MFSSDKEIYLAVVITSAFIVSLICVVLVAIVKYQIRLQKHLQELNILKINYQEEIFKTQLEVQEQTFLHISQEIHDNIGQILSLVRINLSTLEDAHVSKLSSKIQTSKELLDQAIEDLRHLSKRLNSDYVSNQSLADSLKLQISYIEKTGLYVTNFEVHGDEFTINPDIKLIIFRIAQEAINNSLKHAKASNLSVLLMFINNQIIISVKDNGQGMIPSELLFEKGIGLQNMQNRANLIGAQLIIESEMEHGTLVRLIFPKNI